MLHDHTKVTLGKRWSTELTARAMDWAWDVLGVARAYGDPVVYMEVPVFGRGGVSTALKLGYMAGAIQGAFALEGVGVYLVNVSTWKKELARGAAVPVGKPAVAGLVGEQWSDASVAASGDEDLNDAAGVALYGLSVEDIARRMEGEGGMQGEPRTVLSSAHMQRSVR